MSWFVKSPRTNQEQYVFIRLWCGSWYPGSSVAWARHGFTEVLHPFPGTNTHVPIPVCCRHLFWAAPTRVRWVPVLDCDGSGTSGWPGNGIVSTWYTNGIFTWWVVSNELSEAKALVPIQLFIFTHVSYGAEVR